MLVASCTPVRESLERLYQEGYVSRIANRGHYVAEINSADVRDLYETCEAKLTRERLQLDREFHLTLAGETGNDYLVKMLAGVFDRLILKRRIEGFQDLRGMDPYDEHVRWVSALGKKDEAAARAVLNSHIGSSCERFANYLEVEREANPGLSGLMVKRLVGTLKLAIRSAAIAPEAVREAGQCRFVAPLPPKGVAPWPGLSSSLTLNPSLTLLACAACAMTRPSGPTARSTRPG